jgi:hypothetical protein
VSLAVHGRRLDRLERRDHNVGGHDLAEAIRQARQRADAVLAIVDFVWALAGTDKKETTAPRPPAGDRAAESLPPPRVKRPPETRPFEDRVSPPDRNAVLTWDEAMRFGWQVETSPTE